MINKTCPSCSSINGEQGTYCRKCGASLDKALITEVTPLNDEQTEKIKTGPSLASRLRNEKKSDVDAADIPQPPVKPRVIRWPFVVSMVSIITIVILLVAFVMTPDDSGSQVINASNPPLSGNSALNGGDTPTPIPLLVDIGQTVGSPVGDQLYTGEKLAPQPHLEYRGEDLVEGTDYEMTYFNNTAIGTATIQVTGIGDYRNSVDIRFNIISGDPVCDDPENTDFVEFVMLANAAALGRSPDLNELIDQVNRLKDGSATGAQIISEIYLSDECRQKNADDEDFLNAFYLGVLRRDADGGGLSYNADLLSNGLSRQELINGIMCTPGGEFEIICDSLGITPY